MREERFICPSSNLVVEWWPPLRRQFRRVRWPLARRLRARLDTCGRRQASVDTSERGQGWSGYTHDIAGVAHRARAGRDAVPGPQCDGYDHGSTAKYHQPGPVCLLSLSPPLPFHLFLDLPARPLRSLPLSLTHRHNRLAPPPTPSLINLPVLTLTLEFLHFYV